MNQKLPSISLRDQLARRSHGVGGSELDTALDYFRTNHTEPTCTIETCATALSITERRLEQIFHAILGVTPKYCLTHLRIRTALRLKKDNPELRIRIKDIYQQSGFGSRSSFEREFIAVIHPKRNNIHIHQIQFLLKNPQKLKVVCACPKNKECVHRYLPL
jgi:transcriptional regulator GlxA family with amidase domain